MSTRPSFVANYRASAADTRCAARGDGSIGAMQQPKEEAPTISSASGSSRMKPSECADYAERKLGRRNAAMDGAKLEARHATIRADSQPVHAAELSPQQQQAAVRLQRVVRGRMHVLRVSTARGVARF